MYNKQIKEFAREEKLTYYVSKNLENKNQCFVFVSGWGTASSLLDMYQLASKVNEKAGFIIIERFGQGKSDMTTRKRNIENILEELHAVIEDVKKSFKGDFIFVGHSLGGLLALEYAKKFNDIEDFVLLDAVPVSNKLSTLAYSVNYLYAYLFIGMRKMNLLQKSDKKILLNSMSISEKDTIPEVLITESWDIAKETVYNKNVLDELGTMIKQVNSLYDEEITKVENKRFISIVRNSTNKLAVKMKSEFDKLNLSLEIKNLGKGNHYLHNQYTNEVCNICLSLIK